MRITLEQIRAAMVSIAEKKQRPHYDLGVVRDVADAIKQNKIHHLKQSVLQEIYVLYNNLYQEEKKEEVYDVDEIQSKLIQIGDLYAGQKALVSRTNVSGRTISLLIRGQYKLTPRILKKIAPVIDSVIEDLLKHHAEKEKKSHGNYVTYRNGCRCNPCKIAWREYIQDRKEKKECGKN